MITAIIAVATFLLGIIAGYAIMWQKTWSDNRGVAISEYERGRINGYSEGYQRRNDEVGDILIGGWMPENSVRTL
jgi:hypothetical protein